MVNKRELMELLSAIQGERDFDQEAFKDLAGKMRNISAEPVLVVYSEEYINGCPDIAPPKYISPEFLGIKKTLKLGMMDPEISSRLSTNGLILPTKNYVLKNDNYDSKWKLKEGKIEVQSWEMIHLGMEVERRYEPVSNCLSSSLQGGLFVYMGEEVEKYFEQKGDLDVSYVEALKLLGQEAPAKFQEEYDRRLYNKKLVVINSLEGLSSRELELEERIQRKKRDGRSTYDERDELSRMRRSIETNLGKALELGMHQDEQQLKLKPGVTVEVAEYISEICSKYGVESSE